MGGRTLGARRDPRQPRGGAGPGGRERERKGEEATLSLRLQIELVYDPGCPNVDRAREILKNLESGEFEGEGQPRLARSKKQHRKAKEPQLSLFTPVEDPLRLELKKLDISRMTPLDALNYLNELQSMV